MRSGSASYLAPETIIGEKINDLRKADVWAMGIVLFELWTLRTPFIPVATHSKYLEHYRPYVGQNQLERNIPENVEISYEAIRLLKRFLNKDHRFRESLSIIVETEKWFDLKNKLSDKRYLVPPPNKFSIFGSNNTNLNTFDSHKI